MFCPNCGKEIMPGADICFGCGIMINKIMKAPP
ncbi:MAG: zinc-ribbon domain-containing protein, partial [Clostridia bacterium]|nr:zinc-ribbon domain-containing protein [Clostridia bacterium]